MSAPGTGDSDDGEAEGTVISQRAQRHLARILFLAICLVPTLAVLGIAVYGHLPGYGRSYHRNLSERLGMRVGATRTTHPAPGQLLMDGVELRDAVTGAKVASARRLVVKRAGDAVNVRLYQPALHATLERPLAEQLLRLLPYVEPESRTLVDLECEQLVIHWRQPSNGRGPRFTRSVHHVRVKLTDEKVLATFQLPWNSRRHYIEIQRARPIRAAEQNVEQPVVVTFASSGPVPIALVAPALSQTLGGSAQFDGTMRWQPNGSGRRLDLRGSLQQVMVQRVLNRVTPYSMSGTATVQIRELAMQSGRVTAASGAVDVRSGRIDALVLQRMVDQLGAAAKATTTPAASGQLEFEHLRVAFEFDGSIIHLQEIPVSQEWGERWGVLVDTAGQVLLGLPEPAALPITSLIDVLVPASDHRVPATAAAQRLLGLFTWPEVAVRQASQDRGPEATIREVR